MIQVRKAMVMAAGLGTRMRPITDHIPKPLVPVASVTLIDRALDWLLASAISEVVINTHYKAAMLEEHLRRRTSPIIHISQEEVLLETGGGVKKAMPLLGDHPFFATNSDVICLDSKTPALENMRKMWDDASMDVLLLLHPVEKAIGYPGAGDFFIEHDGTLRRRAAATLAPYVFTGVQLIHPRLFAHAPKQDIFSLNMLYDHALSTEPQRLCAVVHDGEWLHIGDPDGLAKAEAFFAFNHR